MMKSIYRYPGVRPFEATDRRLFFGRTRDIEALYDLILLEKLVVLFGKSGYGKSSLLNAGVLPRFTDPGLPANRRLQTIQVRFGAYTPGKSMSPLEAVVTALDAAAQGRDYDFLPALMPQPRLWLHFKMRQSPEEMTRFMLVFDQFEEFFTYPEEQQLAFKTELAELLYEEVPQDVRVAARSSTREQRTFLAMPFEAKALFSIRSDRLSLLDGLKDRLPTILHKRYELQALDAEQAREAIVMPAALPATGPEQCAPFDYTEEALQQMILELSGKEAGKRGRVEAFQLQMVCASIEKRVIERKLPTVTANDLPDFSTVYEDYYQNRIGELPTDQQTAARRVLEDGLLLVDAQTGDARRLSRDSAELAQSLGVSQSLLQNLERTYLVRREANTLGGFNYEISHDTLIAPVLKARREREKALEQQRLLQEQEEAERRAREAEQKAREEAERRAEAERLQHAAEKARRRATIFALGAAALALVAALFFLKAEAAGAKEKQARIEADSNADLAMQEKNRAETEAARATAEKLKADTLRGIAQTSEEQARQALDNMLRANDRIVEGILRDAAADIRALQYDAAAAKLHNAAALQRKRPQVAAALFEVAWFYNESGRLEDARQACVALASWLNKAANLPENADRQNIRTVLKDLLPSRYAQMEARYYPVMMRIKGNGSLPDFQMAESETTVWQYHLYLSALGESILNDKVLRKPGWGWQGDHPVVSVSWYDAVEYANWLSGRVGLQPAYKLNKQEPDPENISDMDKVKWAVTIDEKANGFRLPSGAQWEYAARGGQAQSTFEYAGSDRIERVAWHEGNAQKRAHAVKTLQANSAGLYDFSGNVWEWCWEWSPESIGRYRTTRGGSWANKAQNCRVEEKGRRSPDSRTDQVGIRLSR